MEKDVKKKLYLSFAFVGFLVIIFIVSSIMGNLKKEKLRSEGIETIGVLNETGGEHITIKYYVDDTEFSFSRKEPFNFLQNGEEYLVRYDPSEPSTAMVYFANPILSNHFDYDTTDCLGLENKISSIRFRYQVDLENFTRIQILDNQRSSSYDAFKVVYRSDNPKIGYLLENK